MDEKVKMRVSPEFSSTPVLKTGDGRQDAAVGCELDGPLLGCELKLGPADGRSDGAKLGSRDTVGTSLGCVVGIEEGDELGSLLGEDDGAVENAPQPSST